MATSNQTATHKRFLGFLLSPKDDEIRVACGTELKQEVRKQARAHGMSAPQFIRYVLAQSVTQEG